MIKNIIINGDGADWTGLIVESAKEIFQLDMAHIQKKVYAGKYEIANNFTGGAKDYILRVLKTKKWTELMITD